MVIAVNTTVLTKETLDLKSNFVQEIFKRIAQQNPHHQFVFISNQPYNEALIFSKNITTIVVRSSLKNTFSQKYWYDVKLPLALKKIKPDLTELHNVINVGLDLLEYRAYDGSDTQHRQQTDSKAHRTHQLIHASCV